MNGSMCQRVRHAGMGFGGAGVNLMDKEQLAKLRATPTNFHTMSVWRGILGLNPTAKATDFLRLLVRRKQAVSEGGSYFMFPDLASAKNAMDARAIVDFYELEWLYHEKQAKLFLTAFQ